MDVVFLRVKPVVGDCELAAIVSRPIHIKYDKILINSCRAGLMRANQTALEIVLNHITIAIHTMRHYPRLVSEIDDIWAEMLDKRALDQTASSGHVIADFIALKATNYEIRQRSVDWLIGLFTEMAGIANRHNRPIEIERIEPHNFTAYGANMVGVKTNFKHGIRCLTIEAGWTRLPRDGFMRGGALAVARISHFGIKRHGADLALLKTGHMPEWHEIDRDNTAHPIELSDLRRHMAVLIDHRA